MLAGSSSAAAWDAADLAVVLEDGPFQIVDRADLRRARFLLDVVEGYALPAHVALDRAPVLDEHDRFAPADRPQAREAEGEPADRDRQQRDRRDDDQRPRHRLVALG